MNRLGNKDKMESSISIYPITIRLPRCIGKLEGSQSLDFSYNEMGSTLARFSGKSKFLRKAQLAEKLIHW